MAHAHTVESEKGVVMELIRVHYTDQCGESQGYSFHEPRGFNLAEASLWGSEYIHHTERVDIELTRAGVLRALNRFASHPDNG